MKSGVLIGILIVLIILVGVFAGIFYSKNSILTSENNQLETDKAQLNAEKEQVLAEKAQCLTEMENLNSRLSVLQEDVKKIYKTCVKENACKGRYPGVSWECNNVGDEVSDPSHVCVCDSSCNLNATQIR